ncbi:MAG: hypothetical protein AAGB00_03300 [Planctomycetota bacterium]
MATAIRRASSREHYRLSVNSYDRASSLLVALLVMVAVTVSALLIIFFARGFVDEKLPPFILPGENTDLPNEAVMGIAEDIEPPGVEDAPELTEPSLMDTLNALTSAVSSKVAIMADPPIDASDRVGKGSGLGDKRKSGGGGGPAISRELVYEFSDAAAYARWYDSYGIELGVLDASGVNAYYASNLGDSKPTVRQGKRMEEKRYAFPASAGPLYQFDVRFAQKAGIAKYGKILYQFFPNEVYRILLGREEAEAKKAGKRVDEIKRTVFRVEQRGSNFDFVVVEQLY